MIITFRQTQFPVDASCLQQRYAIAHLAYNNLRTEPCLQMLDTRSFTEIPVQTIIFWVDESNQYTRIEDPYNLMGLAIYLYENPLSSYFDFDIRTSPRKEGGTIVRIEGPKSTWDTAKRWTITSIVD